MEAPFEDAGVSATAIAVAMPPKPFGVVSIRVAFAGAAGCAATSTTGAVGESAGVVVTAGLSKMMETGEATTGIELVGTDSDSGSSVVGLAAFAGPARATVSRVEVTRAVSLVLVFIIPVWLNELLGCLFLSCRGVAWTGNYSITERAGTQIANPCSSDSRGFYLLSK
jgi:hypothetical protein